MEFKLVRSDIADMNVDAVVLPANTALRMGSGCSRSIFEKAGKDALIRACKKIDKSSLTEGAAVKTLGYDLRAEIIIHAIVPKWRGGSRLEYDKLAEAYNSALTIADNEECKTLAIPLLGAGNNGFELKRAFHIAEDAINKYIPTRNLECVYLVVYDLQIYEKISQL